MVLKKLKPGMIVYDVRKADGSRRFDGLYQWWEVEIRKIDEENKLVFASWNRNKPEWHPDFIWKKWRLKRPKEE